MASPPELMDDAIGEILLRIPPYDPAHLIRASLVCKPWRHLLTNPSFLRRYRAFHRTPPVLGFLRNEGLGPCFIPTGAFRPLDCERRNCRVLDCRHGRVLLADYSRRDFLVWDPITGKDHLMHIPINFEILYRCKAGVLCAVPDCDHLDCHGGPFLVVLVAPYELEEVARAWVYSSETGKWSTPTTVEMGGDLDLDHEMRPVLAGDKLYFICEYGCAIFCYDLSGERGLSVIDFEGRGPGLYDSVVLVPSEDGGLRFVGMNVCEYKLDLWSLETMNPDGLVIWTQYRTIQLDTLLTSANSTTLLNLIGTPDADAVFVQTNAAVFMIGLESCKVRKVYDKDCGYWLIFPYSSFFTPDCSLGRLPPPKQ